MSIGSFARRAGRHAYSVTASIPVVSLIPFLYLFIVPWRSALKPADVFRSKAMEWDRLLLANLSGRLWRLTQSARCLEVALLLLDGIGAADLIFRKLGGVDEALVKRRPLLCHFYALALFEIGAYPEALRWHKLDYVSDTAAAKRNYALLRQSYMAAMCDQPEAAQQFFFQQYDVGREPWHNVGRRVWATLKDRITQDAIGRDIDRIGVFFLSSTEALGHALLDPYHFLALNKDRFDQIYFIGPARSAYRPGSRICLEIVDQLGAYIEVGDDLMLNLSWMNLGEITFGLGDLMPTDDYNHALKTIRARTGLAGEAARECIQQVELVLVVKNYWGLLREVYRRHRDPSDLFEHNRWYLSLPREMNQLGEAVCEREGIDFAGPLVVVHLRESNYHRLSKQSFRDTNPKDYIPAIRHLLKRGYQVIRIGDRGMKRLGIRDEGYFEAPFLKCYAPELDSFLISRARFMIGCQSGPCSYARALGVPLLSINAVFHYTLFAAVMEMACFKRYVSTKGPDRGVQDGDEIPISQVLKRSLFRLENTFQFRRDGIRVVGCTPSEIVSAVDDMVRWIDDPQLALTPEQAEFARLAEAACQELATGAPPPNGLADYLGIGLPGYTISPSVAALRHDPSEDHADARSTPNTTQSIKPGVVAENAA